MSKINLRSMHLTSDKMIGPRREPRVAPTTCSSNEDKSMSIIFLLDAAIGHDCMQNSVPQEFSQNHGMEVINFCLLITSVCYIQSLL